MSGQTDFEIQDDGSKGTGVNGSSFSPRQPLSSSAPRLQEASSRSPEDASPIRCGKTLVLGFGNPDREDDGVALHVIDTLRRRLGLSPVERGLDDFQPSGGEIDAAFAGRLVPEHLFTASRYRRMIFVDAHVPSFPDKIRFERIHPGEGSVPLTHQLSPGSFLAWLTAIYGHAPEGYLLSVKAHQFDFNPGLTEGTRALVDPAVDLLMSFLIRNDPEIDDLPFRHPQNF